MDLQSILLGANTPNVDPNLLTQAAMPQAAETIDLEAIAQQAFDAEVARQQAAMQALQNQAAQGWLGKAVSAPSLDGK